MKRFIINSSLDRENHHLTISVYSDALTKLKEILSDNKPVGKAFTNLAKTYVFLYWINSIKQYHVPKDGLAAMTYAKHEDSLTKAIDILKEHGLISTMRIQNKLCFRYYYTYNTYTFDYEKSSDSIMTYEYDIPILTYYTLFPQTNNVLYNTLSSSLLHIYPTDSTSTAVPAYSSPTFSILNDREIAFRKQFLSWYDELDFCNMVIPQGHFSQKDRRYYHHFHRISKEERQSSVLWDGEHIVEFWDAHSAFFIVIGYYLKYVKTYESEDERKAFLKETNYMMKLALENRLYLSLQQYHNKHAEYHVNRDKIKELAQTYLRKPYKRLFNKDGERTKYKDAMKCQYIDEFFQKNFPNIRLWLLHYPRHQEIKDVEIERNGKKEIHKNQLVSVSDLHRDIMPYEFKLISLGLCRNLYDFYQIKSITVHDAIYVKASETEKISNSDINDLLSERLGISDKAPRCYALF